MSATYQFQTMPTISNHGDTLPAWLGDYADGNFTQTDALAASGDYFMVVATRLDLLSQSLPRDSSEQIEVEHLIEMLFYMHKHYDVVPKVKRHQR